MARAINDIMRIREFVAGTIRTTMVLFFTAVVGFPSWHRSRQLTLRSLYLCHSYLGGASLRWCDLCAFTTDPRGPQLSSFVQENLNGIRTPSNGPEEREIARFEESNAQFTEIIGVFRRAPLLGLYANTCGLSTMIYWLRRSLLHSGSLTLGTFAASSPIWRCCSGPSERLDPRLNGNAVPAAQIVA